MAGLRFADLQSRPIEFLDFTSVTLDEFQQLVPPFETAFQARMAAWRMDGKPRTARRFTVYQNCPLPTPEDRLLFILTYLKTYALQVVHGRLFGMVQGKANQWIHVLLPALLAALRTLGDAPARSLPALAQRLGVAEAEAATVVVPLEEAPAPVVTDPAAASASPLLPMTGRNGASSAPKTLLHRPRVSAARKKITPSKTSCECMLCASSAASARPAAAASRTSGWPRPPVSLARGESALAGSGLPGMHAPPRRAPHANQATTWPGADVGGETRQPGPAPSPATHRAWQQEREALSPCERPDPSVA